MSTMKAKKAVFSILDMSLLFAIWGKGKLDRAGVRAAVEINDIFEPVLTDSGELLGVAAHGGDDGEEAMKSLVSDTKAITLSIPAYDSLLEAFKGHEGWTMRGARQVARIEDSFTDAVDVTLEPKKVEE